MTTVDPTHTTAETERIERLVYSITEASDALGIGRSSLYQLMDTGQLRSIKIGTRRLIARADLEHFVATASTNEA